MFKRILVPLDGSEVAEGVLPVVIKEAQCHSARVVLLRVVAPFRASIMMVPALLEKANEQTMLIVESYLQDVSDRLKSEGIEVETRIERGPPAQQILALAENEECDLLVIGTRGETSALGWRFGSVANKIVRARTSIPLLIIKT